eukprot:680751-Hanusia_phi.AAC.1
MAPVTRSDGDTARVAHWQPGRHRRPWCHGGGTDRQPQPEQAARRPGRADPGLRLSLGSDPACHGATVGRTVVRYPGRRSESH